MIGRYLALFGWKFSDLQKKRRWLQTFSVMERFSKKYLSPGLPLKKNWNWVTRACANHCYFQCGSSKANMNSLCSTPGTFLILDQIVVSSVLTQKTKLRGSNKNNFLWGANIVWSKFPQSYDLRDLSKFKSYDSLPDAFVKALPHPIPGCTQSGQNYEKWKILGNFSFRELQLP